MGGEEGAGVKLGKRYVAVHDGEMMPSVKAESHLYTNPDSARGKPPRPYIKRVLQVDLDDAIDDGATLDDVEWHAWPLRSQGGQHVGAPAGVMAHHVPTGIAVVSHDQRSQMRNKEAAMAKLRSLVSSGDGK